MRKVQHMSDKYTKVGKCPICGCPIYGKIRPDGFPADVKKTCSCGAWVPRPDWSPPYQPIAPITYPGLGDPIPYEVTITCNR